MFTEYCVYNDRAPNYDAIIELLVYFEFRGVNLPIYMLHDIRGKLPHTEIISVPIDYPLGISSTSAKLADIATAAKLGANAIDYVLNHYYAERYETALWSELDVVVDECNDAGLLLRVFLDCDRYTNCLGIAKKLKDHGIQFIFPTIGYHNTDFYDTLITAQTITTQVDIDVIYNGYVWRPDQLEIVRKASVFGVRIYDTRCFIGQDQV